ncbi:hypothetical protein Dimus_026150 [Dionaea muscipula]
MADWSRLDNQLLQKIANHLDSSIYVIRFRSVCSAWRTAVSNPLRLRSPHLISPTASKFAQLARLSLSKRTIFLLSPSPGSIPNRDPKPWMVKTEEITSPAGTYHLYNPLVGAYVEGFRPSSPRLIDLSNVRVHELGQEYVLKVVNSQTGRDDFNNVYVQKVAFLSRNGVDGVFLVVGLGTKNLSVCRSGDDRWVILDSDYHDAIVYNGQLYGVDGTGALVMVQVDDDGATHVTIRAKPVFGGESKFLVKSGSDLLLVDMYYDVCEGEGEGEEDNAEELEEEEDSGSNEELEEEGDEDIYEEEYISSYRRWFNVFRFDASDQKWDPVDRLDGQILFLSEGCAFSASASDLHWNIDNCICYNFVADSDGVMQGKDDPLRCLSINVFQLDSKYTRALHEFEDWSEVLYPLPSWIKSAS